MINQKSTTSTPILKSKVSEGNQRLLLVSFRSFYCQGDEIAVDHEWWWPEDAENCQSDEGNGLAFLLGQG